MVMHEPEEDQFNSNLSSKNSADRLALKTSQTEHFIPRPKPSVIDYIMYKNIRCGHKALLLLGDLGSFFLLETFNPHLHINNKSLLKNLHPH